MGNQGLAGKYGNGRTHDPRCNCPDCNRIYTEHNTIGHCTCVYCVEHREIFMPAPRVTRPEEMQYTYQGGYDSRWNRDSGNPPFPKGVVHVETKEKTMGNLNICERPGCNAIIKGNAAGVVDVLINLEADERKAYTLCPPCVSDVDALLHTPPTSDRERAYDKAYKGYETPKDSDDVKAASTEQLAAELFERLMRDAANKTKALGASEA